MSNDTIPLPEGYDAADYGGRSTGPILHTADQMHAHAAAVSAELRADNTRLQNEVVMPLRERIKVLEDLLWTLAEHNELHFGKSHSTVIQCRAALGDKT